MKSWKLIFVCATVATLVGCQQPTVQQAKADANHRWMSTRAQVHLGVAQEYLTAGQLDQARAKVLESLALDEDSPQARLLLGKICIEQGNYASADIELAKVAVLLPRSAEVPYLQGVAYEKENRLDQALASYRKSLAMDEANMPAVLAIAEVLVAKGQAVEAQTHLDAYMSKAGDDVAMYEMAGRLAAMQKQYDKAVKYYQQAHDLDFKNLMYMEALAKAQFLAGQHEQASQTLEALLQARDNKGGVWVHRMLGDCYLATNRPALARDQYQLAADLTPNDSDCWVNLGKAALRMGDEPRAILSAQQALQLDSTNIQATLVLGFALTRDGQAAQAVKVLSQAVRKQSDNVTLLCVLGKAYESLGNQDEARRCFVTAALVDPHNTAARELAGAAE